MIYSILNIEYIYNLPYSTYDDAFYNYYIQVRVEIYYYNLNLYFIIFYCSLRYTTLM